MAVDPRQVLAAILTISMFAMLGNMIKRDHFDSFEDNMQQSDLQISVIKVEQESDLLFKVSKGPWEEKAEDLKPCWTRPSSKAGAESKGYITFSLKSGPEYHMSQIGAAVVIARHLGATLVLPDIRSGELGKKRNFEDYYDVDKFLSSLDGVVKIIREIPTEIASEKPTVVKVPNRPTEDFIMKNIEPIFQNKSYVRLAVTYSSINMKIGGKQSSDFDSTTCLAMFGSLELKQEIREVADQAVERLRTLSRKSNGKFIAVDLRVDLLEQKACKEVGTAGRKSCYNGWEVRDFLKRIGFDGDATIYITQTWWHENLNLLKEAFPKTYTKDDILPPNEKGKYLRSDNVELEKAIDFEVCSQSDVYIPAIPGMFYGSVTGQRIASGRTLILVPAYIPNLSAPASNFISPYVSEKSHLAYSCYC